MKTSILLTLATVAMAALALNVNAGNALLSPKAADSQGAVAPAATADPNLAAQPSASTPRQQDQQPNKPAGVAETRNLSTGACSFGTPKTAKSPSAACCQVAAPDCSAPKACCATK